MPFDAHLQCAFCDREFPDFGPLGQHVLREHPNIVHQIRVVGEHKEEQMLPGGGNGNEGKSRSKRGASAIPFLNGETMLSTTPKPAKILGVRNDPENRFGPSVLVKLALDGQTVMWTLRLRGNSNPNFQLLVDKFGRDENDWVGQSIEMLLEKDEFTEQYYPRVQFPSKKQK